MGAIGMGRGWAADTAHQWPPTVHPSDTTVVAPHAPATSIPTQPPARPFLTRAAASPLTQVSDDDADGSSGDDSDSDLVSDDDDGSSADDSDTFARRRQLRASRKMLRM